MRHLPTIYKDKKYHELNKKTFSWIYGTSDMPGYCPHSFMCMGFNHSWNIGYLLCTNSGVVKWDYLLDLNHVKVLLSSRVCIGFPKMSVTVDIFLVFWPMHEKQDNSIYMSRIPSNKKISHFLKRAYLIKLQCFC